MSSVKTGLGGGRWLLLDAASHAESEEIWYPLPISIRGGGGEHEVLRTMLPFEFSPVGFLQISVSHEHGTPALHGCVL